MLQVKVERSNGTAQYWLPLESSNGQLSLQGPYNSDEEAKAERDRARRLLSPPAKCGIPFAASSPAEARMRARFFF